MTVKIIAEVGSNWTTFEDAKNSIALAKQVGADAVKFQAFDYKALYGQDFFRNDSQENGKDVWVKSARPGQLPLDWLPKLAEKAKACGIEFMCTAFSPELVAAVDPYVQTHKIASAELTHVRLLEAVRKTGKPVILSTGASGRQDISNALEVLKGSSVTLMHCVAAYPARATALPRIRALKEEFGVPVGYSDHSISCDDIPSQAVHTWGATVLEKHFTIIPDVATPDGPHSLTVDQFKYMVDYIKGRVNYLSPGHSEEEGMIQRHNRRLMATHPIAQGEILIEGFNFGAYRALQDEPSALSPWLIKEVVGKSAKRAIAAGEGIRPGDV
jgi:sialic acid synthase SpsE